MRFTQDDRPLPIYTFALAPNLVIGLRRNVKAGPVDRPKRLLGGTLNSARASRPEIWES